MSIIACPKCGNKISSLATLCLHCGFQPGELSDAQTLLLRQRQFREKVYHLKMTSYAVLSALVAGFGWFWWGTSGFQHSSPPGPFILMGLSALAYLVVRALLFQAERKYKELKRLGR